MSDKGKKTILAAGEVLWDLLPDGPRLGGALFNLAARINRLGDRALMVSRLGRDALGDEALVAVRSLGLETTLLQRDQVHPTGTVQVRFDEKGIPDYLIVPEVAYDYIEPGEVLDDAVSHADCFCFGTLVQRTEGTRKTLRDLLARAEDCLRVLDINLRKDCYSREIVEYSLGHADLLKLNDDEVRMLDELLDVSSGDPAVLCAEMMTRYPLQHCLVTFGENGALVVSRTGETIYEPGYRVDVVDTLGSGDAFTAGFVHKVLHGAAVRQACRFGNVLGAMVAMQAGGTEPIAPEAIVCFERDGAERNTLPELERFTVD
jgi:fructokinase